MATFYLSSTFKDLKDYRQRVDAELRRAGYKVTGMENKTASGGAPLATCLADVAKCDAYIGIFAWRYGSIPEDGNPDGKSITELEYRQAIECKKETLIFLLREGVSLEPADSDTTKIEALRVELSKKHWTAEFGDPVELSLAVVTAANQFEDTPAWRRAIRRFWKGHAKAIIGIAVFLVLAALAVLLFAQLIKPRQPPLWVNDWAARFNTSEKLEKHWTFPEGLWRTEPGELADNKQLAENKELAEDNENDEALLVKGQEMGIPNDLDGKQFQDFRAVFKIRFKSGSEKAAWVLRAQADRKGGYLFQLAPDGNRLFLSGWIYDQEHKGESLGSHPVPFGKFRETKSLTIDVVVQANSFSYDIKFVDDQPDKQIDPGEPKSGKLVVENLEFKDNPNNVRWPLGTIGFMLTDDTSVMRVEYVYVYIRR